MAGLFHFGEWLWMVYTTYFMPCGNIPHTTNFLGMVFHISPFLLPTSRHCLATGWSLGAGHRLRVRGRLGETGQKVTGEGQILSDTKGCIYSKCTWLSIPSLLCHYAHEYLTHLKKGTIWDEKQPTSNMAQAISTWALGIESTKMNGWVRGILQTVSLNPNTGVSCRSLDMCWESLQNVWTRNRDGW